MKSATGFRGILAILGSFAAMTGTAAAPGTSLPPSPPGCTLPESRQFDFWIGKWAVHPKRNPQLHVADSLIEKRYSGCAIRENWMPLTNEGGGSLSTYVPEKKRWRQFWSIPRDRPWISPAAGTAGAWSSLAFGLHPAIPNKLRA